MIFQKLDGMAAITSFHRSLLCSDHICRKCSRNHCR